MLNSSSLSDSHMAYVLFVAHSVVLRLYSATYYLHGFFIVNCNCSFFPHCINTHLDLNALFIPHGEWVTQWLFLSNHTSKSKISMLKFMQEMITVFFSCGNTDVWPSKCMTVHPVVLKQKNRNKNVMVVLEEKNQEDPKLDGKSQEHWSKFKKTLIGSRA